jgi:hypothetical protein
MESFRFGKHAPVNDYRTLLLKNYLTANLPAPPPAVDILSQVYTNLKIASPNPGVLFPMDGNDTLGDCTCAALAHAITVYNGMVGKQKIMAKNAIVKLYMHLTGGVDSGCNELNVLNYWQSTGADGEKILAFIKINPKNHTHVQQAIQLFGGVYLGFQVQANAITDFRAGKPWTPGTLTNDGHAVYAVAYDQTDVTVLTWGNTQKGTWGWWDECVDEAYAILPPEAKAANFDKGFNFTQLQSDLHDVAG